VPYIKQELRTLLNPLIDHLAEEIVNQSPFIDVDNAYAGMLNYAVTRLCMAVIDRKFGEIHYGTVAIVTGVLHNVVAEFYRRVASPYEDKQIEKSGDVDLFEKYGG